MSSVLKSVCLLEHIHMIRMTPNVTKSKFCHVQPSILHTHDPAFKKKSVLQYFFKTTFEELPSSAALNHLLWRHHLHLLIERPVLVESQIMVVWELALANLDSH